MSRLSTLRIPLALAAMVVAVLFIGGQFFARERLSPKERTAIDLDGHRVAVVYGRPSMRGRAIFGGLVPWGEVWRTGANEATAFTTEVDLELGGVAVPRGDYTLYTIPERAGWTLIVNRQTGQWGTVYDPGQDLVRIPMATAATARPIEQMTIRFDLGGGHGALVVEWERTRASVPFRAAG